jgi:hypothetical protein
VGIRSSRSLDVGNVFASCRRVFFEVADPGFRAVGTVLQRVAAGVDDDHEGKDAEEKTEKNGKCGADY